MASDPAGDAIIPIVDAHQHFWDLDRNYYPWLCDPARSRFRYGDYSALRRNYLPPDYRRDTGGFRVVKTVHMEAEWDRADPVGETRWLEDGQPRIRLSERLHRPRRLRPARHRGGAGRAREEPAGSRHPPQAAGRARSARGERGAPGSMDDPGWRRGYALLERYGLSYDLQTPWWHLDAAAELARGFPATQIIINHTGLPADRSAEGLAGWRRALETVAAQPNVALKISGLGRARPALDGRPPTGRSSATRSRSSAPSAACSPATIRSISLAGSFRCIYGGFFASVAERPAAEQRKLFHDNAVRIYRL